MLKIQHPYIPICTLRAAKCFFLRSEVTVKYYKIQRPRSKARKCFSFNLFSPGFHDQSSSGDEHQQQLGCGWNCSISGSQPLPALQMPPHPTDRIFPPWLSYIVWLTLTTNTLQGLNRCNKLNPFFFCRISLDINICERKDCYQILAPTEKNARL